jgi:hypothetical protein
VRLKVFNCSHPDHRETTARQCQGCPDYGVAPAAGAVRHLLYHVLPVSHNGVWQRNLDQLKARLRHFNGRRVVAVATKVSDATHQQLDPPGAVRDYLAGHGDVEVVAVPNNPRLREAASWRPLWDRLDWTDDPVHRVFYAHAKGVTKPFDPGVAVHRWAALLYTTLLDYLPLVDRLLERFPVAGSLKKHAPLPNSRSPWHYSGSFFWVRLADATPARVRAIDRSWCGNEAWPGRHFPGEQAAVVFGEGGPELDLYRRDYLNDVIEKEYAAWKSTARPYRFVIG